MEQGFRFEYRGKSGVPGLGGEKGGHPEIDFEATAMRVRRYGAKKPALSDERRRRVQAVVGIGIRDFVVAYIRNTLTGQSCKSLHSLQF